MAETVAFGKDGKVRLWCRLSIRHEDGELYYPVINGGWDFHLEKDAYLGHKMLWQGEVPKEHNVGYNEAIAWINNELGSA